MTEPTYEVLWPLGTVASKPKPPAPRISDFAGKTICELSDYRFRSEDIFPIIREVFHKRYPSTKFVDYTKFGETHGVHEDELTAALPDLLRKYGCDAAVSGVGA